MFDSSSCLPQLIAFNGYLFKHIKKFTHTAICKTARHNYDDKIFFR